MSEQIECDGKCATDECICPVEDEPPCLDCEREWHCFKCECCDSWF